jgi:hypothetical protein
MNYNRGISGTIYRPDLGDMLFIQTSDRTGLNQTNYYSVIQYNPTFNEYFFRRVAPKPGGEWYQPGWLLESGNPNTFYGYYQIAVVSKQNTVANPTGNYGLKVRDQYGRTTFDSRTFTEDAQFRIDAVAQGGTMKPPNIGETDVNYATQLLALGGWCNVDWTGYYSNGTAYVVLAAVKVAAVGGNAQGNFYYGAVSVNAGGFGSGSQGIYNISDIITADIG